MSVEGTVIAAVKVIDILGTVCDGVKRINKNYGFIEKTAKVNIDGVPGKLIWDYILWNDITFETKGKKGKTKQYALYTGLSYGKAKKKWKKLKKKYGVRRVSEPPIVLQQAETTDGVYGEEEIKKDTI